MINFFRKIRKKLADDNKPIKYFRYAIGEILLVMVGILLALQVNNWNQGRLNVKLEKVLLVNLLNDIELDIKNIKIADSIASSAFSAKLRILDFISGEELSTDSVFYYTSKLGPTNEFIPTSITYDEMKNSDGFKVIKSTDIRREIAGLYNHYDKVKDYELNYYQSRLRLQNIRIEDFSTASLNYIGLGEIRDTSQVLNQIKTNRRFINALESNYAGNRNFIFKETLKKVENIRYTLQQYLEKNHIKN